MHNSLSFFSSNGKVFIPLYTTFSPLKPSLPSSPSETPLLNQTSVRSVSIRYQNQIPIVITCSRKGSRRKTVNQRQTKWVLKSLCFVASNLNILPEPLALAITAFVGGNGGGSGGGSGFPKGFGAGGFNGWWRRRKGRGKLGFVGFVMILVVCMRLFLENDCDSDVVLGVLALSLLGVSIRGWRRGFKDWVLGFCFCACLVGLGFRREKLHRFVDLKKFNSSLYLQKLNSLVKDLGSLEITVGRRK